MTEPTKFGGAYVFNAIRTSRHYASLDWRTIEPEDAARYMVCVRVDDQFKAEFEAARKQAFAVEQEDDGDAA